MKHPLFSNTSLVLAIAGLLSGFALSSAVNVQARLIEQPKTTTEWSTLSEAQVSSGATIPARRHVFYHVPASVDTIDREVLLGGRGKLVRYWGYCFPNENDPMNPPQSSGFPGKIYLSEAERAARKAIADRQRAFSPYRRPSREPQPPAEVNPIRHQLDTFRGGMTCYIMSEKPLAIGSDADNDGLNSQREKEELTDPNNPDTDGDGLGDGVESRLGTNTSKRDSDSDGLLDGIEDANHNGRLDSGETDPRNRDTDGDDLCDGLCHEYQVRKICNDGKSGCTEIPYGQTFGEDKNLNGKVDKGESDPRKADTVGDGTRDDVRVFKCILDGKKDC